MKIKDLNLPINTVVGICNKCGELLKVRDGMFGLFIGCDGYKNGCRNSINYNKFEVDDFEYKILKIISDIKNDNYNDVLKIYQSTEFNNLSEELKNKIKDYLNLN